MGGEQESLFAYKKEIISTLNTDSSDAKMITRRAPEEEEKGSLNRVVLSTACHMKASGRTALGTIKPQAPLLTRPRITASMLLVGHETLPEDDSPTLLHPCFTGDAAFFDVTTSLH